MKSLPQPDPGSTRKRSGRRAAIFGTAALAAAAALPAMAAPHPDAELLSACAQFVEVNQRICGAYHYHGEWNEEAEKAAYALEESLWPLLDERFERLLACRARTLAGIQARARALHAYYPEYLDEHLLDGDYLQRQVGALLRDLLAMTEAA